jgi:putative flippase GtrA
MHRLKHPAFRRFLRYLAVGVSTLTLDLLFLAAMTELFGVPYFVAVPIAFLTTASLNYAISRKHVFRGTSRTVHHGYAYFITLASLGAFVTTAGTAAFVEYAGFYYLFARVFVAGFVGTANYLINLHFNFRVAGHHP